jgi:pimeloyl-ACP methyl ester carboxylesterase
LARKGQLAKLVTKQARDCADPSGYPESVDALLRAEVAREWASIPGNTAGLSEEESFSDYPGHPDVDDQEMEHIKADFGDKPLIVLTKAKAEKPEPGMSVAAQARVEAAWIAGHDALAKSSTRGRNIIVPNSKHFIQLDQPETVIKAIESVVADVRKLRLH